MMILSRAASKSAMSMAALSSRVASRAASLTRLARSAPLMPTVPRAIASRSTSAASGMLRVWTLRISSRPFLVGRSTVTWRSNRPGRSKAGSSTSGRLVAASTITLSLGEKPSISVKIWLSVCSRSSWPPPKPAPRTRPTASISSMNRMQGLFSLAVLNMSRTRLAPTPTNIWMNSEPEIEKNGTPASPATARASSVLPVPGRPIQEHALGNPAAEPLKLLGVLEELDDLLQLATWRSPARPLRRTWSAASTCRAASPGS